ncbi:DUF4936 family protein [Oxalobacteraceae bacterium R-40]|uniref:DUF4936 family protein n=1 Tax=Keguizhuia sedimenti TaxID=3064264 RepID=A0ABU1BRC8_9BURK|nr:DUF4936 family protein [Oxalobacteraceae bacterium R-40]
MPELYVYYRAKSENAALVQARANYMQAQMARALGLPCFLKRRPAEKDGCHTWMEVYPAVPDGFEERLQSAVKEAGLLELTEGERHTEIFEDRSACA